MACLTKRKRHILPKKINSHLQDIHYFKTNKTFATTVISMYRKRYWPWKYDSDMAALEIDIE